MRATFVWMAAVVVVTGCAGSMRREVPSTPAEEINAKRVSVPEPAPEPPAAALPSPSPLQARPGENGEQDEDGVMHIVQAGQTLWRIARAYDVPLETIARVNALDDPTRVDVGMPIFIPHARATIDVAPYPAPLPSTRASSALPGAPHADFLWPIAGGEFMRPYGEPRRNHRHAGVDIRGTRGQQILATRDGVVAFSGRTPGGYGTMVVLDHGDGLQSLYAHASSVLVNTGDPVTRGEAIALVGRTGNATTEHCHFEIRVENHPVDPMPFLQSVAQVRK